ncbi:histidine kinase [Flavobacterium psychrophilum]|uniref:histidine kinase n=1 Tax=Flavobacterium psychrophilum TaxID=96345 RepID=UPI0004F719D4|nr:histidine kinase [Flavobacterium psychrophilum]AIN74563.1 histidine kinase [Flavobacterium psychrophilum FPG3]EKT2068297.1 histidine kinase [Flavobacterium psychrophilum]EKT2071375.1 histidine kinase [Flavobacterium psychrophilum]EKT3958437.1 histidine kinase [Flavobacterium psychrophilum]EKT4490896.1 histidine kinase [Flavobacterium psychrophilum]
MENQRIRTFSEIKKGTIACLKISVLFTLISVLINQEYSLENIGFSFLISSLYSFGLGFGNGLINNVLDKNWDWLEQTNLRVYLGVIATILYTIPVVLGVNYVIFVILMKLPIADFFSERIVLIHLFYIILSLGISTFMHARSFMINWKNVSKKEVIEQKIIAGTASAKFESLKNQIDPHFLFNSLNVLSSLIEENPENAQRFTTSLSKIYRYVLEQKDKELVSVDEELAFAKTYMNLLKMRFENSLTYEITINHIAPSIAIKDAKVVPLSLQLLLENTVKHNVVSEQKPLHIKIFIDSDYLVIQNNFQKKDVLQDRKGLGLQNIINRYGIISNRKVLIEQTENTFSVRIPILTKQITVLETNANYAENNAYYRAKKRVEELKGFYGNLISYCCVIPILVFINLRFSPEFQWFWYSAVGWGFGLMMHAFKIFGYTTHWEERKIQEILDKQDKNNCK